MSIQTLRSWRLWNIALFDLIVGLVGTVILMLILWKVHFSKLHWLNFVIAGILLTIPLGIFFHILFGVNTQLNYRLGLSDKPSA